jgi:hypothetical protein
VDTIHQNRVLPPGIDIEPVYDRADLVKLTTHTVMENLLVGMILVSLVLWLFLGNIRAALITAINIPLALLFAFSGMVASGTAANLISLGAVDFGIVVDSTVIVMESIFVNFVRKGGSAFWLGDPETTRHCGHRRRARARHSASAPSARLGHAGPPQASTGCRCFCSFNGCHSLSRFGTTTDTL